MNKVVLIGRWTKDIDLSFTPGTGTAVAKGTIAVDRRFKKEGAEKEADYIPIVIWGKQAEATANSSAKGKLISIAGRIQTRSYENKEKQKVYITEVVAEEVQFIEWAKKPEGNSGGLSNGNFGDEMTPVDDGDIPF